MAIGWRCARIRTDIDRTVRAGRLITECPIFVKKRKERGSVRKVDQWMFPESRLKGDMALCEIHRARLQNSLPVSMRSHKSLF